MVARNTWRRRQKSCCRDKPKNTWSIRRQVKSFMVRNGRKLVQSILKIVRQPLSCIHTCILTLHNIVLVNNHAAVWGSWYDLASGTWGYACCHSVIHLSYCTGESGKEAAQASSAQNLLASSAPAAPQADAASKSLLDAHLEESGHTDKGKASGRKKHEDGEKFNQDKMTDVLNEERKRKSRADEGDDRFTKKSKGDERETKKFDVTEDELGASISSLSLTDRC